MADERASSAIEYALILSIIVGGAFLGADLLGSISAGRFAQLASMAGQAQTRDRADSNLTDRRSAMPVDAGPAPGNVRIWHLALAGVLGLGLVIHHVLHRRNGPAAAEVKPAEMEPLNVEVPHQLFAKRQMLLNLIRGNLAAVMNEQLYVGHLMSKRLTTVLPGKSARELREMMAERKLRHLLVCDEQGGLLGIISDRDLNARDGATAASLMTRNPLSVSPNTAISPAVTLMMNKSISCLPVVEEGQLRGILTTTDLLLALQCSLQVLHRVAGALQTESDPAEAPLEAGALAS